MDPLNIQSKCDGCGEIRAVGYPMQFWKNGLFLYHNVVGDEGGLMCTSALTPKAIYNEPLLNYGGRYDAWGRKGGYRRSIPRS